MESPETAAAMLAATDDSYQSDWLPGGGIYKIFQAPPGQVHSGAFFIDRSKAITPATRKELRSW